MNDCSNFSFARVVRAVTPRGLLQHFAVLATALLMAGTMTACDQLALDEAEPTNSISLDETLSSRAGFEGLIISMYDRLQGTALYGQQYMLYPDALADNVQLVPGSSTNRYPNVVANAPFTHLGGYGGLYSTINEANNIIADIEDLQLDLPPEQAQAVRDKIRGEALFLRGLAYFDLVRIYSYMPGSIDGREREVGGFELGVPLRLEPTRSEPQEIPRVSDQNQIYDRVISDFADAETLLEGNAQAPSAPSRITSAGAAAYLSRVHLYLTNWEQAEQTATRALDKLGTLANNPGVVDSRSGNFEGAWKASTYPGSIFELSMTQGLDATGGGSALQDLTFFFGSNFAYEVLPSADVRAIYDSTDARTSLFATDPDDNVYLEKYSGTIAINTDRIPLFRVAELYLNRAEARAQQESFSDARDDLDFIRVRRGLSEIDSDVTGQALVDEILEERRREFLFEGKRFFDLKRYALPIQKATDAPIPYSDGPLSRTRLVLAPIPTGEVQSNTEVVQNPGY